MEQMKDIPVYRGNGQAAREAGELDLFKASNVANKACCVAIDDAIRAGFDGMHLKKDAAKQVIADFGMERVEYVLANTIQRKDWDGRFSLANKRWAAAFAIPEDVVMGMDRRAQYVVTSHPAVLDGFVNLVRAEGHRVKEEQKQPERASVRNKLNVPPPEHKPGGKRGRGPER